MTLEFLPIDLDHHRALCITFAEEMNQCGFGLAAPPFETEGYIQRMRNKLALDPESCLHVWQSGEIIGQINLGRFIDPSIGYVNVFYVIPEWRGKGVADVMEEFTVNWFKARGFCSAYLSVSPTNTRAMRFYLRRGWRDLGPRDDKPALHNMKKRFESPRIEGLVGEYIGNERGQNAREPGRNDEL